MVPEIAVIDVVASEEAAFAQAYAEAREWSRPHPDAGRWAP